jgi:peptidoglycan/xylan/chitin deacetylase (PgdA/CDA1 family)
MVCCITESQATVMPRSVVNVIVHGIGPLRRELEPGEDETWVSVEQFERLLDAVADRPEVRITFDDGNTSDVEIGLPRLLERGLTAEFFLLAGRLGEPGRIDAAGVRELVGAGMEIGSHGWAHRDWRRIDDGAAQQEIHDARRVLTELAGRPVSSVAIPFGSYDRHVLRRLRRANVARAYTSDGGWARADSWLQVRNGVHHDLDTRWIRQVLDEASPLRARARGFAARTVKRVRG